MERLQTQTPLPPHQSFEKTSGVGVKRNLPRDVFLHLLGIIMLYWSVTSFITLLFQIVNYFFPDPAFPDYYLNPLRFAVASLIVVFPVFVFASWFLNKNYIKDQQLREIKLRKWVIYFTLFSAALLIIGDLVRTILVFLEGEMTLRFFLKALSILIVACFVFGYYFNDIKRTAPSKKVRCFVRSVCVLVFIGVAGAFFIIGSPKEARLKQFDQQKIDHLQAIQSNIINYWQKKQKLPENLADLDDPISGFSAPVDSQTGASYEYNIKDADTLTFELCAVFNRERKYSQGYEYPSEKYPYSPYFYSQNWDHNVGRVCFERKIDKELYPPIKKD